MLGWFSGAAASMLAFVAFAGCSLPACAGCEPPLGLTNFSMDSAEPMAMVEATMVGADPSAEHRVRFSNGADYSWEIPVRIIEGDRVSFVVPPYYDAAEQGWGAGQVTLALVEVARAGSSESAARHPFEIAALPETGLPAGRLTASWLWGAHDFAQLLAASETPEGFAAFESALASMASGIDAVSEGSASMLDLGGFQGEPIHLAADDLAMADRLLLATLDAAAGAPASTSGFNRAPVLAGVRFASFAGAGTCTEASNKARNLAPTLNDIIEANERGEGLPSQQYLSAVVECVPEAAVKSLEVVSASGGFAIAGASALGVEASALALPSLALHTTAVNVGAWLVSVGLHLRGLADETARRAVEAGTKILDEELRDRLNSLREAFSAGEESPMDAARAHADALFESACNVLDAVVDWKCPKITEPTPSTSAATSSTTAPTTPRSSSPTSSSPARPEEFWGPFSGDLGSLTALNGCVWSIRFSGDLTVEITRSASSVTGQGTGSVTIDLDVSSNPPDTTCNPAQYYNAPTGSLSGSASSFGGMLAGTGTRPVTIVFQGSLTGDTVSGSGSLSRQFGTTSTSGDTPPETHTAPLSGLVLQRV